MASLILRSSELGHVLGLFCLLLLVHKGNAYEFIVGGQKGWSVPSDPNSNPYNQWAEKSRFQIGDSLVFNYQSGQDSVLQVSSDNYASCNTDAYSAKFSEGHTVIKLNQSGPHYFISGNKNNCLKNEKLVVIVLADRSNRNSNTNQTGAASPSPSPQPSITTEAATPSPAPGVVSSPPAGTPAPAQVESPPPPSGTGSGAPAPAQIESPPPPPEGTAGTPAPSQQEGPSPPHNAAASILVNCVGYVGAFMASVMILSF